MRGKQAAAAFLLVAAAAAAGCSRGSASKAHAAPPAGNGVWFTERFRGPEAQGEAEATLARGGFSWVLLSAARIERRDGTWFVVKLAPPPGPVARLPVFLVIEGGPDAAWALASKDASARRALEETLILAGRTVAEDSKRFGRVTGIHLDLPFPVETASLYGEVLRKVRQRLPSELFLSVSVTADFPPGSEEKLRPLARGADGVVAMIFGEHDRADPASVDLLGKPWWAGYAPGAEGRWTGTKGEERGPLPESVLAELSDNPRLEFHHDFAIGERAGLGYVFKGSRPFTAESRHFATGDEVTFRQPPIADMVRQLGTDLAGRRFARGRVLRLAGASEAERIFTLAAFNEILPGRSLVPDLRVSVELGKNAVAVSAENLSPLPSALSRIGNWIEVDLGGPGIRDVRPGGFERYEVFGGSGRPVSLGRASRVRLYETLIGPSERIEPASILMRRAPPSGCCRFRLHLLAATGTEFATDWSEAGKSGDRR